MSALQWMKFAPSAWRGDQGLRAVGIAARGLWIECLCIMHEAKPYGHLMLNGQPVDMATLSRMTGVPVSEATALMAELEAAGVLSRTGKGVVYSRRMTKDHMRATKGRKAANKRWGQAVAAEAETGPPNGSPNGQPTPKPEAKNKEDRVSEENEKPAVSHKSPLIADWSLPADWLERTRQAYPGVSVTGIVSESVRFKDHYRAEGATFSDWEAKWRNWLRRGFPGQEVTPAEAASLAATMKRRVRIDAGDPLFKALGRLRGVLPPTDRAGGWWFPAEEVQQARALMAEDGAPRGEGTSMARPN